jgi:glycosyltransferase involved in cell wall biosynthesis
MTVSGRRNFSVAVVMPAYHAEKTITKALESIFHQSIQPCDVWIVDDHSSDATVAVARHFISERCLPNWHIIPQSTNVGPGVARHIGIMASSADYIALLDSDDEWLPIHLERSIYWIEEYGLELFGGQFGDLDLMDSERIYFVSRRTLLFKNPFKTSSAVFSRQIYLQAGGFDAASRYSEDYLLWLRMCLGQHCKAAVSTSAHAKYAPEAAAQFTRLTKHLWKMEKAELSNYKTLFAERKIGGFEYLLACQFSLIKYAWRIFIAMVLR